MEEEVRCLDLGERVRFLNRFLEEEELLGLLKAVDLFILPYGNDEQISSGTLTFALALGLPVVSTPFPYAQEPLGEGAGVLVPPEPEAMAQALFRLVRDPGLRSELEARARRRTQGFRWPEVAQRYLEGLRALKG